MTKLTTDSIKVAYMASSEAIRRFFVGLWMLNVRKSCTDITLGNYLQVICRDKYQLLRKSWLPVPKLLLIHGLSQLFDDYNQLSTDPQVSVSREKSLKIGRLSAKHNNIYACYKVLQYRDSEPCLAYLRSVFTITDDDNRLMAVKKSIADLKGLDMIIANLKTKSETHRATMSDYDKEIGILSREQGYRITKDIILAEYIQIQNRVREEFEMKKQMAEERKNGTRNH